MKESPSPPFPSGGYPIVGNRLTARVFVWLLLPIIGAGGLLAGCQNNASAPKEGAEGEKKEVPAVVVATTTASVASVEQTVTGQGTFMAMPGASARVSATVGGRIASVLVKEGDSVVAGQVVATLDTQTQLAQGLSAAATYEASVATARQLELSAKAAIVDQESAVKGATLALKSAQTEQVGAMQSAKTALELAQSDLTKLLAGARPQEIAQVQTTLTQAEATKARAQTEIERAQFLYEKGVVAKRQLDDAQTALTLANASVTSAQNVIELLKIGARKEERDAANLRVRQAKEQLSQASSSGDAKIKAAQALLSQAMQGKLAAQAKQSEALAAQKNVNKTVADQKLTSIATQYATLRAPIAGVVTKRSGNVGEMADSLTPIVEISNSKGLVLQASLPAESGKDIRAGMKVRVTPQGITSPLMGRVDSVGQVDPMTNLLTVKVLVSNGDNKIKAGEFATVQIVTGTHPNAVTVPRSVVLRREGKLVLFIVGADNIAHQKEIELGAEKGEQVEIVSGVKAGEKLVSEGQYELADGAKVSTEKPEGDKAEGDKKEEKK